MKDLNVPEPKTAQQQDALAYEMKMSWEFVGPRPTTKDWLWLSRVLGLLRDCSDQGTGMVFTSHPAMVTSLERLHQACKALGKPVKDEVKLAG